MMLTRFYNSLAQFFCKLAYKAILCLWFFTRPTVYGVYIAVWYKNNLLVIKNSYKKRFTIPCGRIKHGEELAEAAIRELHEEVNIIVTKAQLNFVGKYSANYSHVCDVGSFFEIEMSGMPNMQVDNREVVWAQFMTFDRALTLSMNPTVKQYLDERFRRTALNSNS